MKNCQERLRVYLLTLQELESSSENCLNAKRKNSKNKKRWISWKIKKIQIKGVMEPEMKESPRNYTQVRQIISVTLSYSTFWRAGDTNTSIKSTIMWTFDSHAIGNSFLFPILYKMRLYIYLYKDKGNYRRTSFNRSSWFCHSCTFMKCTMPKGILVALFVNL